MVKESLIREFSMMSPSGSSRTVDYALLSPYRLMVYFDNGDRCVYNSLTKIIRHLSNTRDGKSEYLWRKRFSDCLIDILLERGLTQKELSERSSISETTLSFYMNRHRTPSAYMIEKLSTALECTTEDLLAYQ